MFFDCLEDLISGDGTVVCTVVDGDGAGARCLYRDGEQAQRDAAFPETLPCPELKRSGYMDFRVGDRRIFAETLGKKKKVVICGGGHVAQSVLRILKMVGYEVVLLEDRPFFAAEARKLGADEVLVGSYEEHLRELSEDPDLCYLVMTRGHRHDMECLRVILRGDFVYAGMMSSRMRVQAAKDQLRKSGISAEAIERLYAPVGLRIGAETPEEIAVSVAAELISKLHGFARRAFPKEITDALGGEGRKILAEVIARRGPAPREPGAKMVVLQDGGCAGTIGGGCMEAEVIRRARQMMQTGGGPVLMDVNLTDEELEDEGMACGGVMEVFLAPV